MFVPQPSAWPRGSRWCWWVTWAWARRAWRYASPRVASPVCALHRIASVASHGRLSPRLASYLNAPFFFLSRRCCCQVRRRELEDLQVDFRPHVLCSPEDEGALSYETDLPGARGEGAIPSGAILCFLKYKNGDARKKSRKICSLSIF